MKKNQHNRETEIGKLRLLSGQSLINFSNNYGIPIRDVRAWESGEWDPPVFIPKLFRCIIKYESVIKKDRLKEINSNINELFESYTGKNVELSPPGEVIIGIRESLGLTKKQFSKIYGIPYTTLGEWERSRRVPKPYTMVMLKKIIVYSKELEKLYNN